MMSTPGALMSGFKISGIVLHGPREENSATLGAALSTILSLFSIIAFGFDDEFTYFATTVEAARG